mgnify:CR=1 FL=1
MRRSSFDAGLGPKVGLEGYISWSAGVSTIAAAPNALTIRGLASAPAVLGSDGKEAALVSGAAGGIRTTTRIPEVGRRDDKSPATPAAKDKVLSANAAATMRRSDEIAKSPPSAESPRASRHGETLAAQLNARLRCPD